MAKRRKSFLTQPKYAAKKRRLRSLANESPNTASSTSTSEASSSLDAEISSPDLSSSSSNEVVGEFVFEQPVPTTPVHLVTPENDQTFDLAHSNNIAAAIAASSSTDTTTSREDQREIDPLRSDNTFEVIDVDKLPDRPDSPIGDDVIEIIPESSNSSSSEINTQTHRRFVDLTDTEESTPTSIVALKVEVGIARVEKDGDDNEDDLPCALPLRSSPKKPSLNRGITCPVCMEDAKQITTGKKQLMSTTCGHIFCSECIKQAIEVQKKCPTCRKKVTKKQLHPIFI